MRSLSKSENAQLAQYYRDHYSEVYKFPALSAKEIRAYQFGQVKQLVKLAYDHTSFYKEKYDSHGIKPEDIKTWQDFELLPTVTKEEIIANKERCVIPTVRSEELILSRSSGSSGTVIEISMDGQFFIKEALITLRMYQQAFDYQPSDKQALIYTSIYPYQSINDAYKATYINTLTPIDTIVEQLITLRPNLIVCYPSNLLEIMSKLDASQLALIRPKAIVTNSEYSSRLQRKHISDAFDCPVFDEYSSEELSRIAFQCKNLQYHLQEDCSYIETFDLDSDKKTKNGDVGEITGTCLLNQTMPFIRYRQGDMGKVSSSVCNCGNNSRILTDIAGRKNDRFLLKDSTQLSSGRLLDWTYKLILEFRFPILQFELVQHDHNNMELRVVPSSIFNTTWAQSIAQDSFAREFGRDLHLQLTAAHDLPKTKAGKHLPIRCLIKQ